jgi:hypothetical protein
MQVGERATKPSWFLIGASKAATIEANVLHVGFTHQFTQLAITPQFAGVRIFNSPINSKFRTEPNHFACENAFWSSKLAYIFLSTFGDTKLGTGGAKMYVPDSTTFELIKDISLYKITV